MFLFFIKRKNATWRQVYPVRIHLGKPSQCSRPKSGRGTCLLRPMAAAELVEATAKGTHWQYGKQSMLYAKRDNFLIKNGDHCGRLFRFERKILVLVESFAGFAAEETGTHHLAQQRVRTVLRIAELVVEHFHDGEVHIVANQVGQCQRAHRMVGT